MTRYDKKIQVVNLESFLQENTKTNESLLANPNEEKITKDIPDVIIEGKPEEETVNKDINNLKAVYNSYDNIEEGMSSVLESFLLEADGDFDFGSFDDNTKTEEEPKDDNKDATNEENTDDTQNNTDETPEDGDNNTMGDDAYGEQDDNSIDDKLKNSAIIDNIISCYKNLDIIKSRLSTYIPMDKIEEDTFNMIDKELDESKKYIVQYLDFKAYHSNSKKNYAFLLKIKGIIESVNNTMEIIVKSRNKNLTMK